MYCYLVPVLLLVCINALTQVPSPASTRDGSTSVVPTLSSSNGALSRCIATDTLSDIIFLIDQSGSINDNFQYESNIVYDIIGNVIPLNSRVGLINYSGCARGITAEQCIEQGRLNQMIGLNDNGSPNDLDAVLSKIQEIEEDEFLIGYLMSWTNVALQMALQEFTSNSASDTDKMIVLITDQAPYPNTYAPCISSTGYVSPTLQALRELDVAIVSVGIDITPEIKEEYFECLSDADFYFKGNFDSLSPTIMSGSGAPSPISAKPTTDGSTLTSTAAPRPTPDTTSLVSPGAAPISPPTLDGSVTSPAPTNDRPLTSVVGLSTVPTPDSTEIPVSNSATTNSPGTTLLSSTNTPATTILTGTTSSPGTTTLATTTSPGTTTIATTTSPGTTSIGTSTSPGTTITSSGTTSPGTTTSPDTTTIATTSSPGTTITPVTTSNSGTTSSPGTTTIASTDPATTSLRTTNPGTTTLKTTNPGTTSLTGTSDPPATTTLKTTNPGTTSLTGTTSSAGTTSLTGTTNPATTTAPGTTTVATTNSPGTTSSGTTITPGTTSSTVATSSSGTSTPPGTTTIATTNPGSTTLRTTNAGTTKLSLATQLPDPNPAPVTTSAPRPTSDGSILSRVPTPYGSSASVPTPAISTISTVGGLTDSLGDFICAELGSSRMNVPAPSLRFNTTKAPTSEDSSEGSITSTGIIPNIHINLVVILGLIGPVLLF